MEFLERKIKKLVSWVHTGEINQNSFLGVHLLIMRVHCADTIREGGYGLGLGVCRLGVLSVNFFCERISSPSTIVRIGPKSKTPTATPRYLLYLGR